MKTYLLRYSEIGLKSAYVRKELENLLIKNLKEKLVGYKKIIKEGPRIIVKTGDPDAYSKIKLTPGIVSFSIVDEISQNNLNSISKKCKNIYVKHNPKTFKIETQRINKNFKYKSVEVNKIIGEKLSGSVDLKNPELTIYIEINHNKTYIFTKKENGIGGLPYGSQGNAIVLLSKGIDSPVAAFLIMKRGVKVTLLHLGEKNKYIEKIKEQLNKIGKTAVVYYPFKKIQRKISELSGKYTCVICKRSMIKIAEKIANQKNADAIVTGFNIGQVASQTLKNIRTELFGVNLPVLMPLIGYDKQEIINLAKIIGTYDLSQKNTKCSFVPKHPATTSNINKIKKIENKLNLDLS